MNLPLMILIINILFTPTISAELLINQTENIDLEYEGEIINSSLPIHFWRDASYPINDSHIYPMLSIKENGNFEGLGISWITWTIQVGDQFLGAWAIFDRGQYLRFTVVEKFYDRVSWASADTNLFLFGSTSTDTDFYWYSTERSDFSFSLEFPTSNHQMYFTSSNIEISLLRNNTIPLVYKIVGFSTTLIETDEVLFSSFPGIGGLYTIEENASILLRTDRVETVAPIEFTNQSQLGHFLLSPAIYDVSIQKAWVYTAIPFSLDLPNDTIKIFDLGLSSSVIQTQNNSFYEYTPSGWTLITMVNPKLQIQDFSVVDIGLYFGTIFQDGLQLLVVGRDSDKDFIPDTMEDYYFTLPENNDSDHDTIPDAIEISYGTNPIIDDRLFDTDGDGVENIVEYNIGIDPGNPDSDFGGAFDGWEINYGFNPLDPSDDGLDNDGDGLENADESESGTNPYLKDTDGDGMPDKWEVDNQLDPLDPHDADFDYDGDGRSNYQEFRLRSDPLIPDPSGVFEGLYIWIVLFLILAIPGSYKIWQNYITEEKDELELLEKSLDDEELIK
jgi:hypothetical protein